jgi:flagellar biosynthesis anti-sigma factor FlgM
MKIDNNILNQLQASKAESAQQIEKQQKQVEKSIHVPKKDTLEVSENARLLAKASAALNGVEESRSQKVNDLKELVNSGDYKVPHEELAKRIASTIDIKR